jgi:hypothetical protein
MRNVDRARHHARPRAGRRELAVADRPGWRARGYCVPRAWVTRAPVARSGRGDLRRSLLHAWEPHHRGYTRKCRRICVDPSKEPRSVPTNQCVALDRGASWSEPWPPIFSAGLERDFPSTVPQSVRRSRELTVQAVLGFAHVGLENRCGPFGPPRVRIPPPPLLSCIRVCQA